MVIADIPNDVLVYSFSELGTFALIENIQLYLSWVVVVVKRGHLLPRGFEFKFRRSRFYFENCFKRTKINKEEAGIGPFFTSVFEAFAFTRVLCYDISVMAENLPREQLS